MKNMQIPIYKSMVYKQTHIQNYKHFHTKHGKIHAHTLLCARMRTHIQDHVHTHTINKEHTHTAEKDIGEKQKR